MDLGCPFDLDLVNDDEDYLDRWFVIGGGIEFLGTPRLVFLNVVEIGHLLLKMAIKQSPF